MDCPISVVHEFVASHWKFPVATLWCCYCSMSCEMKRVMITYAYRNLKVFFFRLQSQTKTSIFFYINPTQSVKPVWDITLTYFLNSLTQQYKTNASPWNDWRNLIRFKIIARTTSVLNTIGYLQNLQFAQSAECLLIQTCDFIVIDLQTSQRCGAFESLSTDDLQLIMR